MRGFALEVDLVNKEKDEETIRKLLEDEKNKAHYKDFSSLTTVKQQQEFL